MAKLTGTYDVSSLLAAQNTSAVEFGVDNVAAILAADNANFSEQVESALSELAATSTDRQRVVGTSIGGDMMEVDEYGQGPTQKDIPSYFVGFPLRKFQFPIGWTVQWEKNATAADYAIRNAAAQAADLRRTRYELQKVIYTPTNYTFIDHLGPDKASLSVKAALNADSLGIANGPDGQTFDGSTHTHYDGSATLTAAAIQAQINDVIEHRNGATVRVYINQTDAAAVSALVGFNPLQVPYLTINSAANQVANPRLDVTRMDNRQIGWFGAAEVWTKPWAVANYSVAADVSAPQKPILRRVEKADRGLHVAAQVDVHPLRAQYSEHFYGFGVWNRSAIHVLKFNNATYAAPTLAY